MVLVRIIILRTLLLTENESYKSLPHLIGMNTLKHRRYSDQALLLIYKSLNSIGPKYIADFRLNLRNVCYNLRGNGSNLLQPHFTTKMHKSFLFIATSKLWSKLPLYIRNSDNLNVFKKAPRLQISI